MGLPLDFVSHDDGQKVWGSGFRVQGLGFINRF